jgi:hypothetical protein
MKMVTTMTTAANRPLYVLLSTTSTITRCSTNICGLWDVHLFCLLNSSILKTIKLGHLNVYYFSGPTDKIDWFSGCPRTFHCKLPLKLIMTIFVNLSTLAILKYIMVTIFFYRPVFNINPLISRWKDLVLSESMYRKIRQVFSAIFL